MRDNFNLAVALLANLHRITQIAHAVVDFDLVVQEFLKRGDVEDFVRSGLRGVDDVLEIISRELRLSFSLWFSTNVYLLVGRDLPSW